MLKMLFGEVVDENNPEILSFPHNWGVQNEKVIKDWIRPHLMTEVHRSELMMTIAPESHFADQLNEADTPTS